MSEDVMSEGIMVPLTRKMNKDEYWDVTEELYNMDGNIGINMEGTLAYTENRDDAYGISFGLPPVQENLEELFKDLKQFDLGIVEDQARTYRCLWYNGSDSDMTLIELEDFLARTGQA